MKPTSSNAIDVFWAGESSPVHDWSAPDHEKFKDKDQLMFKKIESLNWIREGRETALQLISCYRNAAASLGITEREYYRLKIGQMEIVARELHQDLNDELERIFKTKTISNQEGK